jgi:hypothetical protein
MEVVGAATLEPKMDSLSMPDSALLVDVLLIEADVEGELEYGDGNTVGDRLGAGPSARSSGSVAKSGPSSRSLELVSKSGPSLRSSTLLKMGSSTCYLKLDTRSSGSVQRV